MKNKKTLGYILLLVGSGLGLITLIFAPIAMVGCFLLLNEFKPGMGKFLKITLAVIIGTIIPLLLATIVSFMFY